MRTTGWANQAQSAPQRCGSAHVVKPPWCRGTAAHQARRPRLRTRFVRTVAKVCEPTASPPNERAGRQTSGCSQTYARLRTDRHPVRVPRRHHHHRITTPRRGPCTGLSRFSPLGCVDRAAGSATGRGPRPAPGSCPPAVRDRAGSGWWRSALEMCLRIGAAGPGSQGNFRSAPQGGARASATEFSRRPTFTDQGVKI